MVHWGSEKRWHHVAYFYLLGLETEHDPPEDGDAGFVEWDGESTTITCGPLFAEIAPVVELLTAHRDELSAAAVESASAPALSGG